MLGNVFLKTLRDRSHSVIGWSLVFIGLVAMYAGFYPALRDQAEQLNELIAQYPEGLKAMFGMQDLATPAGYLNTEFFTFMVPLFFIIIAIGSGSSATINEVERGTIDLLMSSPVPRTKVVLQKYLAFAAGLAILSVVLLLALIVGTRVVDMDISVFRLASAVLGAFLVGCVFGASSLVVAVATGSKGVTIGINAVLGIVAFVVDTMAAVIDWLEPYRILSPFYHSGGYGPLFHGFSLSHTLVLAVPAIALVWMATWRFERRDLAS